MDNLSNKSMESNELINTIIKQNKTLEKKNNILYRRTLNQKRKILKLKNKLNVDTNKNDTTIDWELLNN